MMELNKGRTAWKFEGVWWIPSDLRSHEQFDSGSRGSHMRFRASRWAKNCVCATWALLIMAYDCSGVLLRSWTAHETPVLAMDFDSTSTLLATGSADGSVKVWDIDYGFCTHVFRGHGGIVATVRFFKMKNGDYVWPLELTTVWSVCVSCVAALEGHNNVVRAIDMLENGARLVSGGRVSILKVWNLETKQSEKTVPVFETVEAMGIVPDTDQEPLVYKGGDEGLLAVWNLRTGKCGHQNK
ncbi:WD40-repeat-containing domain protein [Cladochytrium replicatum]|nr:WD40-repeat-containing domain protein [Cladochytrium replicatum]